MTRNETIYGEGILTAEINRLGEYLIVTDQIPWQLCKDRFIHKPTKIITPNSLEQSDLDKVALGIPNGVDIVGLGGGSVLDAAKYLAYLRARSPILVPTITSSNAPFSDFISIRRQGRPFGLKKEGWPRRIIVDFDVIRLADPRLNRAGYGDILFLQTTLEDWRISARAGRDEPVNASLEEDISKILQIAIDNAVEIGSVSRWGIETLMKLFEDSTEIIAENPSKPLNAGAEHLFAWNLENVTGKHFIHGEVVSLGIIISSYLQKSRHRELLNALDEAQVVYRPYQIGVSWSEIEETLLTVNKYNHDVRKLNTIFDEVKWTPKLLNEIRELIYEV